MFCVKHATPLVYILLGVVNVIATDFKQIQRRIERERQVEKIKTEIMKKLGNASIWTNRNDHLHYSDSNFGYGHIDRHGPDRSGYVEKNEDITQIDKQESPEPEEQRKPIISVGEPNGDRRDGCLRFSMNRIAKDNKNVTSIIPVKVNLYVYIRKKRDRSKNSQRRIKKSDRTKSGAKDRKYGNRNRRKQKGRKIKLFVSNGHKRLSTMRMRVRKSMWRCIDLPISQFPEVIYIKDTFKICLKCKRCNKNVKVDLYRKQKTHKSNKKPTIPFIHIETANNLSPHHIYRHKRSHKNKLHCKQSCCKLESFKVDITKTFPTILAPKELFFKYCLNTCAADVRLHNSTVDYIAKRNMRVVEEDRENHHRQCLPQTYTSFSFLYLLPNSDVKVGTIPNMFPASCQCLRSHQSNYIET